MREGTLPPNPEERYMSHSTVSFFVLFLLFFPKLNLERVKEKDREKRKERCTCRIYYYLFYLFYFYCIYLS
jgi:hypothetical protein